VSIQILTTKQQFVILSPWAKEERKKGRKEERKKERGIEREEERKEKTSFTNKNNASTLLPPNHPNQQP
jgi:hypothetical protein